MWPVYQGKSPPPPPSRITGGDFSAAYTPPSPFTQLSRAVTSSVDKSPPPPPPHPQQVYGQILAASTKLEDGLHFEDCEYDGRIWTATVIIYKFSGQ